MSRCAFIFFDESLRDGKAANRLLAECREVDEVILAPLTTDDAAIDGVRKLFQGKGKQCTILPFVRMINEKALEIRNEYIEAVRKLSTLDIRGKSLIERFCYSNEGYSSWWFGRVPEKCTIKSRAFHRFVIIRTVEAEMEGRCCSMLLTMLTEDVLLHALETRISRESVSIRDISGVVRRPRQGLLSMVCRSAVITLAFWRRVRRGMRGRAKRLCDLHTCRHVFVTYFPLVDRKAYAKGKYVNRYLGPLQRAAEDKYGRKTATIALGINAEGWTKFDGIDLANKLNNNGSTIIFLEEVLSFFDFFKAFARTLHMAVRYWFVRNDIEIALRQNNRLWFWEIWREELDQTFWGGELFDPSLMYRAFIRIFEGIEEECVVTYLAEKYAWEAALNAAAHSNSHLKTVGIQHTQVPLLLLNYFESPEQLKWNGDRLMLPLPDRLGCVGSIAENLFLSSGWPHERTFQLGALRAPAAAGKEGIGKGETLQLPRAVTVSMSYGKAEAIEILRMVVSAFRGMSNITVYIRFHPALPPVHFRENALLQEILIPPFMITDEPNEDLMQKSCAMIVGGSSSCLTALDVGRKVIVVFVASALCLNPLFGLSDLPVYVSSSEELRRAVLTAVQGTPEKSTKGKCFARSYWLVHGEEGEYLHRLEMSLATTSAPLM